MEPYEENPRGHEWQRNEDGDVDVFAFNPTDPHNGPRCVRCGYGFCVHCHDLPEEDCTAVEGK